MVNQPTSMVCPSCGAPLPAYSNETQVVCQYCNTVLELPQDDTQTAVVIDRGTFNAPRPPANKLLARIIVVFMILSVASVGVLLFVLAPPGQIKAAKGPKIYSIIDAQLLPSESAAASNKIVGVSYNSDESYRLSLLDFSQNLPLSWQSDKLDAPGYQVQFKVLKDNIFVVADTSLSAYRLSDGQKIWQTSISDQLPGNCPLCLILSDDKVFVLTQLGSLHVFDATSGKQIWTTNFDEIDDAIYLLNGNPLIVHSKNGVVALTQFDAQTGDVLLEASPTCPNQVFPDDVQGFNLHDTMLTDLEMKNFFILYGFWKPGCLEKWHGFDMKQQWQTLLPEDLVRHEPDILQAGAQLFFSNGAGDQIWQVSEGDGEAQLLLQSENYNLRPLILQNETLLVEAMRKKGTARYELWAIDLPTGKQIWQVIPKAKTPITNNFSSSVSAEGIYLVHALENNFILVQAFDDPARISFQQVDLQTGVISQDRELILPEQSIFSLSLIDWQEKTVWLNIDGVIAIDSDTATITHKY